MQTLDLWLHQIDTDITLPLFENDIEEYTVPSLMDVDWNLEPGFLVEIVRYRNFAPFKQMASSEQFKEVFAWLLDRDQSQLLLQSFDYLLSALKKRELGKIEPATLLTTMLNFLRDAPFLAISFGRMEAIEAVDEYSENLQTLLEASSVEILRSYILSEHRAEDLVVAPLQSFLSRVRGLTFNALAGLIEVVSLTVRQPDIAMDILLECFERESTRLLPGRPALVRHFVRNSIAIALDHIGDASEQSKAKEDLLKLRLLPDDRDGYQVVEVVFRIDSAGGTPENSAHVRLTAASPPVNSTLAKPYSIDALVIHSEQGLARFQCFHPLPRFYNHCSWKLEYCGPYTTTKTMFDAVRDFAMKFHDCCQLGDHILLGGMSGPPPLSAIIPILPEFPRREDLNTSQNAAVQAALNSPLSCLWGPPGTGKTETIVEIICALQASFKEARILVTAPTHNAVDNAMRRYISRLSSSPLAKDSYPLRVSTEVRKVAEDLRTYTCDAMVGQEIYANRAALDQARERVQRCGIVFTTCIGSGLGLLRSQSFDIVIVDEASQQTEAASLVPLVKGCKKAILVGDHVQLRPTVHQNAIAMEFDKSLFERLFVQPTEEPQSQVQRHQPEQSGIARVMLDTQYRMHESICAFSSQEFYGGKLLTGIKRSARPLFNSLFPWPPSPTHPQDLARMLFVECAAREELGGKSKTNKGQADLCLHICTLLCTKKPQPGALAPPTTTGSTSRRGSSSSNPYPPPPHSIAVLTPYARQAALLKRLLAPLTSASSSSSSKAMELEVSSIDGFQGREADVVVLVTVRCNETREIGFLKDKRRMNVALTRARAGVIVVGNRETLTRGGVGSIGEGEDERGVEGDGKRLWARLVGRLVEVFLTDGDVK